ncbi:MAG TPA: helix-turn-helix transcriptional regulator [Symbiobacteriaceae bacterium]|jgi:transcriptional regulator with XRE-family HTH domain
MKQRAICSYLQGMNQELAFGVQVDKQVGVKPPYSRALADRLKMLRESLGMVQQEIADLFNSSRNVPSQWESGLREPSYEHLLTLAEFYGVTTDWLLGRAGAQFDDHAITAIKRELAEYLQGVEPSLKHTTPGYRFKLAVDYLSSRDPRRLGLGRIATHLMISQNTLEQMCSERIIPTGPVISRLAHFAHLPQLWFYQPEPVLGDPIMKYRSIAERLQVEGVSPETAKQLLWGPRRIRQRRNGDP